MTASAWTALLPGLTLALAIAPSSAAQVRVVVHNYAHVSPLVLSEARLEAGRVLWSAGVQPVWLDCRPPDLGTAACTTRGPDVLRILFYPSDAGPNFRVHPKALGFSLTGHRFIGIFPHRVRALAIDKRINPGRMLGHVIAHEIGHSLLGYGGHSVSGIMKYPWGNEEFWRMENRILLFSPSQRIIIQRNIRPGPPDLAAIKPRGSSPPASGPP